MHRAAQYDGRRPSIGEWLHHAITCRTVFPWNCSFSTVVANAYSRIVIAEANQHCREEGQHAMECIVRTMRDLVVMAAVSDANGVGCRDAFKGAINYAFGRQLDKNEMALMLLSFHTITKSVEGTFASSGTRLRPRRERQPRSAESRQHTEGRQPLTAIDEDSARRTTSATSKG